MKRNIKKKQTCFFKPLLRLNLRKIFKFEKKGLK